MKKGIFLFITLLLVLVGCSQKEEKTESNQNTDSQTNTLIKDFLEHSYTESDIQQWDKFDDYASKQLKNNVKNQKQSYDGEGVSKEVENISIYKNTDNDKEYMYNIKVKTTDESIKNIDYNQRYGIVKLKNENGKLKINSLKEVGSETYNGGE